MNQLDWQLICFVGGSLLQEAWHLVGLPQVQYWELKSTAYSTKEK